VLGRARRAPHYRGRFPATPLSSLEQWARLPVTTKEDLRAAYPFGLLAVERTDLATYHESSGTSGEPTPSYFTDGDWDDIASRFLRNGVDLSPDDAVFIKTPYSLVTTAHQMHRAARQRGALVIPADNRSSNMPYRKVVRLLRDLEVSVAWCLPTETLLWAAAARQAGLSPERDFPKLRAFVVAGEPLTEAKRQRIESLWGGIPVFQDYGSTETGSLAGECSARRLHFWSDRLYPEVLPDDGPSAPSMGRGSLVVTPLFREAMPLVRYRLDDTVEISDQPCPCGSPFPTLQVLGRATTSARIQGRDIFPSQLEEAVYSLAAEDGVLFWRARFDSDRLEMEIEAAEDRGPRACQRLTEIILERMRITAQVRPVAQPLIPKEVLSEGQPFFKPRFLFAAHEDWNQAIRY
jgi:phenylacetate-CoA ligase